MIRIKIKDTVIAVKEVKGYPYCNQIVFHYDDDKYTITLTSDIKVEWLLRQACECGFIDFDKERGKYEID